MIGRPTSPRALRAACVLAAALALGVVGCAPAFHPDPLPDAPEDYRFARLDHAHLRFIDQGEGPVVVLVHGFASSLNVWKDILPELTARYRVIAVDLMGFGWSNRPDADYSPAAQAELVWKLLDRLGVGEQPVRVVAHSWGASVALAMALQQQERTNSLALYAAWALEEQLPSFFLWAREPGMGELLFQLYYEQRVEDRMRLAYFDTRHITVEELETVDGVLQRPGTKAAALAATRGQRFAEMQARYEEVQAPTLLLWGEEDHVSMPSAAKTLLRMIPDSRIAWYPRCGHFPMVEAREASTRDLLAFLREVDRSQVPQ